MFTGSLKRTLRRKWLRKTDAIKKTILNVGVTYHWKQKHDLFHTDCVESGQIRSFFWSVFSCIRTEYTHRILYQEIKKPYFKMLAFDLWKYCFSEMSKKDKITIRVRYFWNSNKVKSIIFLADSLSVAPFLKGWGMQMGGLTVLKKVWYIWKNK